MNDDARNDIRDEEINRLRKANERLQKLVGDEGCGADPGMSRSDLFTLSLEQSYQLQGRDDRIADLEEALSKVNARVMELERDHNVSQTLPVQISKALRGLEHLLNEYTASKGDL